MEIKGPGTCQIDECDSPAYMHVRIRFFAGEFAFILCKYHLEVATKVKPQVVEGHRLSADCGMPGADWYRLHEDNRTSTCLCADGEADVSIPAEGDGDE